jgi:hypothetical protein
MSLGIRNRHEQHCPVCEQSLNDDQQTIEAQELLFVGAAAYAWCPGCSRQVPGPWHAAYQVRWAEAFARRCARQRLESLKGRRLLWRLASAAGTLVELTLAPTDSGYALHYSQNGEEQGVERFASRESALFRADELKEHLQNQGFARAGNGR